MVELWHVLFDKVRLRIKCYKLYKTHNDEGEKG